MSSYFTMNENRILAMIVESHLSSTDSSTTTDDSWSEWSSMSSDDDTIYDDNNRDVLIFPLLRYLTTGNKRNRVEDYLLVVESWSDMEFKEHFRLSRRIALQLIDELDTSDFIPKNNFGKLPIAGKLSFYIFLWFMSNTEPLRTISDRFDVSISSVFRVIRRVLSSILTKLNAIVKWPETNNEILAVCNGFYGKQQIPNIFGAIDCTHIRIVKPTVNGNDYCNRKKYFSVNLQAVVDSCSCITNVYCGEPGSLHDARVFRRSSLYHSATENQVLLFPNNTFLIGDSAYSSLSWLIPPFRDNGRLTRQQVQFNFIHSSTRMAVERAFGMLKGRFRRIKFFTEYRELSFVIDTVIAACILHNYCINENDDFNLDETDDGLNIGNIHAENVDGNRLDRRMTLLQELFPQI